MTFLTPRKLADQIVAAIAHLFGVTLDQIFSRVRARQRTIVRTRAIAMWMMRAGTTMTWSEIGRYFARDHSSVCHAVRLVDDQLATDELLRQRVEMAWKMVGMAPVLPVTAKRSESV